MRHAAPAPLWRALGLALLVFGLTGPGAVHAEEDAKSDLPEVLEGIDGKAMKKMVDELAADDMKGRKTGFPSGELVENWIIDHMGNFGLHPADAGGAYLEPFTFPAANTEAPIAVKLGGTALTYGEDYYDLIYGGAGEVTAKVAFVGYGIHRPDDGWDDYAGVDVKGKVVMAIRGAPPGMAQRFAEERYIGYKSSTAADQGAVGFILVQAEKASTGTIQGRFHRAKLPAIWCSGAQADRVLSTRKLALAEVAKRTEAGVSFVSDVEASLSVKATFKANAVGHNALGMIKGRDPDLSKEIIIIGAHMDHLGVDPTGRVFNGADDNASGTAVLVHLADVLTRNRWRPKRSILFVGFGAEEQGLYGSRALAQQLPFQHGGIACVLNMDMVGQGKPKVIVGGGGPYPHMRRFLQEAVPGSLAEQVEVRGGRTGAWSDHWPFHDLGIAAFSVGTEGPHPNYHTHLDDSDAIDPNLLALTARSIGSLVVALGNHPEPLVRSDTAAGYLVRTAPRVHRHRIAATDATLPEFERGLNLLEVDGRSVDPAALMKRLAALHGEDKKGPRVVANRSEVRQALSGSSVGILPLLEMSPKLAQEPGLVVAALDAGYRWVAPFQYAPSESFPAETLGIVLSQLRALGGSLLVDRAGMAPAHAEKLATLRFTERPVGGDSRDSWMNRRRTAGPRTLLVPTFPSAPLALAASFPVDDAMAPVLLSGIDPEAMIRAVLALQIGGHIGMDPADPGRARLGTVMGLEIVDWFPEVRTK